MKKLSRSGICAKGFIILVQSANTKDQLETPPTQRNHPVASGDEVAASRWYNTAKAKQRLSVLTSNSAAAIAIAAARKGPGCERWWRYCRTS